MGGERKNTICIDVREIARVEGHGNLTVRLDDGQITRLELQIVESPRFFEAFLRGRRWDEAPHITGRVCGICSITHTTAAAKAIESACGIEPSPQTIRLRKLLMLAEVMQSHVLHLCFLAIPDYFGVDSVIPLASSHPELVRQALRMKRLANDLCQVIAGRHIHPPGFHVGGFSHFPGEDELKQLRERFCAARTDANALIDTIRGLTTPAFERPTEHVAIVCPDEYALYDGRLASTHVAETIPAEQYHDRVIERVEPHTTAKHVRSPWSASYAVGALSRYRLNHTRLHPEAQRTAAALGLHAACANPFANNLAQCVEVVHCLESAVAALDELLSTGIRAEPRVRPTRFGRGVGAVEAPRGVLFHEYELDEVGVIRSANLVIPTGQNLANIEDDLRELTPRLLSAGMEPQAVTNRLEMLIRAYDPCISCATHFLTIEWVKP